LFIITLATSSTSRPKAIVNPSGTPLIARSTVRTCAWSGRDPTIARLIITPEGRKNYNTLGSDENFGGSIHAPDPQGYFTSIHRDMSGAWLFGLANGDADYVWRLMGKHPERLKATESEVDGIRRITLSADLPSGRYSLEVEPDFEYRIRRFSFEKFFADGHFPPIREEDKKYLPEGKDHAEEFVRGTFEVERFAPAGALWFPAEARFEHRFHYTHMDEPAQTLWRARVDQFEILDSPPPPETFEMIWPPDAQVFDRRLESGPDAPGYFADGRGELHPMKKLQVGDPAPPLTGKDWFAGADRVDLGALGGKRVFIYNWATWCGPCVAILPQYQKIYEAFASDARVVFLGLNAYDKPDPLARFMKDKGLRFPQLLGKDARIAKNLLGFVGAGSGVLVGPDGRVLELNVEPERLRETLAERP
jgi:thiol-disulfide isomerase/thioredoxin